MTEDKPICPNGHEVPPGNVYCGVCGQRVTLSGDLDETAPIADSDPSPVPSPATVAPPPGWLADPNGTGAQRWWDGRQWTEHTSPPAQGAPIVVVAPRSEKSAGLAIFFTIMWPGAGHMYVGAPNKGTGSVIANAIGFVLLFTGAFFLTVLIWFVTLCMTIGSVNRYTDMANEAAREGRRLTE